MAAPAEPWGRVVYVVLALITIGLGLVVHVLGTPLNAVVRDVVGDALWATMIAWWIGAVAPRAAMPLRGVAVYLVCAAVEMSQAYHTSTLDAIRATRLGHLVLGSGFDPRDLAAYAVGVGIAMLIEAISRRWTAHRPAPNVRDRT